MAAVMGDKRSVPRAHGDMRTALLGLAHHLPPAQPVGGVRRPIATDAIGPSDLAVAPGREALAAAGLAPEDIELLIFATMTPDVTFPGSACYFQDKFGLGTVGALDVRGQCAGYLMALMIADDHVRTGLYRTVMVAAGEIHSSGLDYSERGEAVARLYGDGAAVSVLGVASDGAGIESVVCRSDGRHFDRFWIEHPSSRQHPLRITVEDLRAGKHFPRLDIEHMTRFAADHLPEAVRAALTAAGTTAEQIDCFILSHVLPDVVAQSAATLAVPARRLIVAGATHGHLTAASLPVALSEACGDGRLGAGARVCLATCGAGYTWAGAVLTL
jgi:3-oxoacyl-[acyl-carrier-protein] synthase-3